ncbi:MAG: (d)CMP kinase [Bacilli bacterium]|jgi:cytidylate kinase|nr:(d)CMP kinase [Bacilli bacterium]
MNWQIAIDGPAGSGKSTIAQAVAKELGFEHIDTGAMYRAVTLKALKLKINLENEEEFHFLETTKIDFESQKIYLDDQDVSKAIRSLEVTNHVSLVSKYGYVRKKMVTLQQFFVANKNVIMDGRDIGTVVLPQANLKIYLNANVEERAKRRMKERLEQHQETGDLETTIKEIIDRDYKDSTRLISPLKKADDAIEIDSSNLSVECVVKKIISLVFERGYKMEKELKNENVELQEQTKEQKEELVEEQVTPEEEVITEVVTEEKVETPEVVAEEKVEDEEETLESEDSEASETTEVEETSEEETAKAVKYKELQIVSGTVVEVIPEQPENKAGSKVIKAKEERVLITLEDGQEGFLFKRDTAGIKEDEDLIDLFCEGDKVEVAIKKIFPDGGKFIFSTILLNKRKELEKFGAELKRDTVFTAKVLKQIQVGLLMKYEDFSCLLPTSQAAVAEDELATLVGKEISVAPIRVDYGRIRIIVSQILADRINARADKKTFMETLEVGQIYDGVVKNIERYGAFVEISKNVEGLLHISEIDHSRVFKVEKVLNVGDSVKVKVIKLEKEHIGLSRKALIPNYWEEYINGKAVGELTTGKVLEINNSGVVMALTPEISGFLPKSEFSWDRDVKLEDSVKVDEELEVKIIEIDATKKRIILSKKQLVVNPWQSLSVKAGDVVDAKVTKALPEGFIVTIDGVEGYLPKSTIRSIDPNSVEIDQEIKAKIRVLDPEKNKLVLSMRDAEERIERETFKSTMDLQDKMSNTFGDYLKQSKKK